MDFWLAAVIIVFITMMSRVFLAKIKNRSQESEKSVEEVANRVARLEDRMANIETLILEKERENKFNALHDNNT